MQVEDGSIDWATRRNPGELIMHGRTKKMTVWKCQGPEVMVLSAASTEW